MKNQPIPKWHQAQRWLRLTAALVVGLFIQHAAFAATATLNVVDGTGTALTEFRWLLEEDNTAPGIPGSPQNDTVSLKIHKSHAPVVATGSGAVVTIPDAMKKYVVSVMADGYQLGGAHVPVTSDLTEPANVNVNVILNHQPLPTAQINVLVFHDNNPINNAPDATEVGLAGFQLVLADFAGGPVLQDAFANPLGTTYKFWTEPDVDADPVGNFPGLEDKDWNGNGILELTPNGDPLMVDGAPVVDQMGDGFIYTDANGRALIKYLAMGKYGVQCIPPNGSSWSGGHGTANVADAWHQTSTIEGTLTVDAWVGANEPMVFMEGFGPGFYHVFFGFVDPSQLPANPTESDPEIGAPTTGDNVTVTGNLNFNHFGAPPVNQQFAVGPAVTGAWVGLNEVNGGVAGRGLYVTPCDPETGAFSISNVPPGQYQLVWWDKPLDALFGFSTIIVPGGNPSYDLGNVLAFRWFGSMEGNIFYDENENGFLDAGEEGIPQMAVNLRWRDGTVYQSTVTDNTGEYSLTEIFPFFKWLVAEVDFARFKATGMTAVSDAGGLVPPDNGWAMPSGGVRTPQAQFVLNPDGTQSSVPLVNTAPANPADHSQFSRTEAGPVLTEAVMIFLNQNNRIDWGKKNYGPGDNGGISGIVGYGTTRAEDDPRDGTIDPWEAGIPRVQVALYQDLDNNRIIDDLDGDGHATPADVDNYPFDWTAPADGITFVKGVEDADHNGDSTFDPGDAIQITWTDCWDDVTAEDPTLGSQQANYPVILGKPIVGSDNYPTWNQVRPQIFDGGYAFTSYFPGGIADLESTETSPLPTGNYIVQAFPPPGYLIQTEESVNVTFGDAYIPSKLLLAPELVGTPDNHVGDDAYLSTILPSARAGNLFQVPPYMTLFPGQLSPAPFAGHTRPLADMKIVRVAEGKNAAADFHVYTEVPKATRVVGFVLNDLTAEFNAYSPIFGEKGSPGWLPISFRDWAGHEVARTYCDEHGCYEALVPSTYTVNVPMPSGVAPNMLTMVLNDKTMPNPLAGQEGQPARIPDPAYNPAFATTPWTLHYYPGTFLYADTPIVPIAAFTGGPNYLLDVEPVNGTPVISKVFTHPAGVLADTRTGPYVNSLDDIIEIRSLGNGIMVPDPTTLGDMVPRNYGFANAQGVVKIDDIELEIVAWNNNRILARLPAGTSEGEYQLTVTRTNGRTTPIGITLTYDPTSSLTLRFVSPVDPAVDPFATPIQDAIDASAAGDLILVATGEYFENPIIDRPVRLQGSGVNTVINATPNPAARLGIWHEKVASILGGDPFTANEAPGFMVLGNAGNDFSVAPSGVDGFQITGAIAGGGITVYDGADNFRISNNRVIGNQGGITGGISVGMHSAAGILFDNPGVTIEFNEVLKNGGVNGGGGIGIYTGATGYKIRDNFILGNFTRGSGGGISHQGVSNGGLIANNTIAFNEVFHGVPAGAVVISGDGGGIYIAGEIAPGGISSGSGSVTIINNLIQGNLAGAGHGGGIRLGGVNGSDVLASGNSADWYAIDMFNNTIVNNVAGNSAGGISLRDAVKVRIIHNTIANNDSSATAIAAFGGASVSTPQGAGIVSHVHTPFLGGAAGQLYCDPELVNNIIWQNRSYFYDKNVITPDNPLSLAPAPNQFNDLSVAELPGQPLNPVNCVVSDMNPNPAGTDTVGGNPRFIRQYANTLFTAIVSDEAGNNISVRFEPTGLFRNNSALNQGNYHLRIGDTLGAARNAATPVSIPALGSDIDGETRPATTDPADIGSDESDTITYIIPPLAPEVTVTEGGPLATDLGYAAAPIITPLVGAGVAPGPMVKPEPLNPLPGHPTNPLLDPEPTIDSDGDGVVDNDLKYIRLSASDGFATMADGNVLYTFGFNDLTYLGADEGQVMTAGTLKANFAAPTIVLKEGQHVYLDVANVGMMMRPDLFDPHTVHFHGFPQAASIFDGEPMASLSVNMGSILRYYYNIVEPGTFLYHCHVEATEHMEMGMIGNLWVEPIQNETTSVGHAWPNGRVHTAAVKYAYNDGDGSTAYDAEGAIQFLGFDRNFHEQHILVQPLPFASLDESYPMINGRGYPDTVNPGAITTTIEEDGEIVFQNESQKVSSLITAQVGDKILLRVSNVSISDFHTLTVNGLPMTVVGKDARLLRGPDGKNLYIQSSSVTLGGGETADVILDASNVTVPAGADYATFFAYDARLNHLNNDEDEFGGAMTEIHVYPNTP